MSIPDRPANNEDAGEIIARLRAQNLVLSGANEKFASAAAHELGTLLHIMMLELGALPGETARRMERDIRAVVRKIERLRASARLGRMQRAGQDVIDLGAITVAVAGALAADLMVKNQYLEVSTDRAQIFHGDAVSVEEAVRNMIENVISHTPEGTRAVVTSGPGRCLMIEDGNKALQDFQIAAVTDRIQRGDDLPDGKGVGLIILRQTASLHGASIDVARSALGGLRVVLDFGGVAAAAT